jgi:predicted ATPase/serine/threonine protein kinase
MSDLVGQQLGTYGLLRLLGQGSFATVYLSEQPSSSMPVAIKVFHKPLTPEEGTLFRQDEIKFTRLSHPHLVRVLACGVEGSTAFLVMAYVGGGTLRERHPSGSQVALATTGAYVQQLASALQYLHEAQLVHGNLKPENILVEQENQVLLSDFTTPLMAQRLRLQGSPEATRTSTYLAPESIQGRRQSASDQYALAILVYEWLTGQPPFVGSMDELAAQHLFATPASLRQHLPSVPAAVEQVVLTALSKDPRHRFASVQDFATAFLSAAQLPLDESLLGALPPLPIPPPSPLAPAAATPASTGPEQSPVQHAPAEARQAAFNNLPTQLTPLIGRQQEIQSVCALVLQPEVRLVTLVGTGGVGKTRLGLQIATELLVHFADGACFVSLAPLSDPGLVIPTIAKTLSLREVANQSALEQLKAYLHGKQLLLLLDNFEQILPAGPELTELLLACPELKILVTSRTVLHLQGEYEFAVSPLELPDLSHLPQSDQLAQYAAVAFFVQRVKAIKPDFQLTAANARTIVEICLRLDGLPLAIELAAARVKLLPPQMLLARLSQSLQVLTGGARDLPARQQTLQKTMAWSYDLLTQEEQCLFRRLAVFVGGCTLEAVEAVVNATGDLALDVLEGVGSLLDRSLVQQTERESEEPRLMMLETIREFGLERLTASGELERTRAAHAHYFLALAEQAEPALDGPTQARWIARLEQEHDNLRAALEWALEQRTDAPATERWELGLRLSVALKEFWLILAHYREARTFLERALAVSEGTRTALRARVLRAIASVAEVQDDIDRIEVAAQHSLALSRELEDICGIAESLGLLAAAAWLRGKIVEAVSLHEEQVRLLRQVGEPGEVAEALFKLAEHVSTHGEYARGQALFAEALQLFRQAGNELWVGGTLVHSASWLWFTLGDLATMRQRFQEGQALITKVGDRAWSAECFWVAALLALSEGEPERASSLAQESLSIYREKGVPWYSAWSLHILGKIETQRGELPAARRWYQQSLALNQQVGEKWMTPFNLEGLAGVVASQGELRWAAQLWGAAEALREAMDVPRLPVDRVSYEQAVAAARVQLGEDAFASAWSEGRTMTPERALAAKGQ